MALEEVRLTVDEREALRLADLLDLSHEEAGRCMGVSRATFGRILQRAHQAVADALIHGKAISVEGGSYRMIIDRRSLHCRSCGHRWEIVPESGGHCTCPACGQANLCHVPENLGAAGEQG
jgi:predicted DNA-binding protein (UPF0251 family)